jgi:hypothetical protein
MPKTKTKKKQKQFVRGRCRYCACTYTQPCYPPCCWIDRAETVCSACFEKAKKDGVKLVQGAAMMAMMVGMA